MTMSPAPLIAAFYFTFFGALGIFLPFFTLVLVERGLSPTEATRLVSALPLMSLVAPPLLGLCAAIAFALPAPPPAKHDLDGAWRALLGDADLPLFLAAVMMAQMATSAYDSAFTLHLARLDLHGRFIGVAWATGVA